MTHESLVRSAWTETWEGGKGPDTAAQSAHVGTTGGVWDAACVRVCAGVNIHVHVVCWAPPHPPVATGMRRKLLRENVFLCPLNK